MFTGHVATCGSTWTALPYLHANISNSRLGCNTGCLTKHVNIPNLSQTGPQCRHFVEFLRETALYDWEAVGSMDAQMNDRDNIQASRRWICMCVRRRIAFSQYEADTRRSRLFVFIWWQLTAVFPFNKIRLKKLVVHSLICHLTEGATWGRPYPIHSERLIRDSLIHRGAGLSTHSLHMHKATNGRMISIRPQETTS